MTKYRCEGPEAHEFESDRPEWKCQHCDAEAIRAPVGAPVSRKHPRGIVAVKHNAR